MLKILTADDSATIREMLAATIQEAGFVAHQAIDGRAALAQAQATQFDLILTDVNMPNLNGFELVQALRKLDNYRYTPILVITTENSTESKQRCRAVGATGWIEKPFVPAQVCQLICKILGQ